MSTPETSQPHLTRLTRTALLWSIGVSLFWVLTIWGFWDKGPYALGLNAFVYMAATTGLFLWVLARKGRRLKDNLYWIVPLGLIILSFLIYDNPVLKMISMPLLLILSAGFYNHGFVEDGARTFWSADFLTRLIGRGFSLLAFVGKSIGLHGSLLLSAKNKNGTARRVVLGLALFLAIAGTVIIPLLSTADAAFASQMSVILEWLRLVFSTSIVSKAVVGFLLSVMITAATLAWSRPLVFAEQNEERHWIDPIISGIVLGGILGLYLLFLGIQLKQLWVGSLPLDFSAAVLLVKSGFWQLLLLGFINIVIYLCTYRKTVPAVQKILGAFMVASLLLLSSAAHRMALYVIYYGFSYEKFFASYTVLFCAILFVWLISRLFVHKRSDIIKFVLILFLWMYALLTVFPVEQFVLRTNVSLAQRPDSRIRLYELTMLSPDVLGLVKKYQKEGKLDQIDPNPALGDAPAESDDWRPWIDSQEKLLSEKVWYEKNLLNLLSL